MRRLVIWKLETSIHKNIIIWEAYFCSWTMKKWPLLVFYGVGITQSCRVWTLEPDWLNSNPSPFLYSPCDEAYDFTLLGFSFPSVKQRWKQHLPHRVVTRIKYINTYKEVRTKPGTYEVQHRCDKLEPQYF